MKRLISLLFALVVAVHLRADEDIHPRLLSQWPAQWRAQIGGDFVLEGNNLIIPGVSNDLENQSGTQVFDISNPQHPQKLRTLSGIWIPGIAERYWFSQDHYWTPRRAFDLSDPVKPTELPQMRIPTLAFARAGTRAYQQTDTGVSILDVTDPFNPRELGSFRPTYVSFVNDMHGDILAFPASNSSAIQFVDVTDPTKPIVGGSYFANGIQSTAIQGKRAFVSVGVPPNKAILHVVDLTNLSNPTKVAEFDLGVGSFPGLSITNNVLIAAVGTGISIFDVSDPSRIRPLSTLQASFSFGLHHTRRGDLLFFSTLYQVTIADISNPSSPSVLASIKFGDATELVEVADSTVAVSEFSSGLKILNAQDPTEIRLLREIPTTTTVTSLTHSGQDIYFVAGDLYRVRPIANFPPEPVASLDGAGFFATTFDQILAVGRTDKKIDFFDLSSGAPAKRSSLTLPEKAGCLASNGQYLFAAGGAANRVFSILDVSNLSAPSVVGTATGYGARTIAAFGNQVAVGVGYGLDIYDVTNPAAPHAQFHFDLSDFDYAASLQWLNAGSLVVLMNDSDSIYKIDLTSTPPKISERLFGLPDSLMQMRVQNDIAFIAARETGLLAINIGAPIARDPKLQISQDGQTHLLHWNRAFSDYTLMTSPSPSGPWQPVPVNSIFPDLFSTATIPSRNTSAFYLLRKL